MYNGIWTTKNYLHDRLYFENLYIIIIIFLSEIQVKEVYLHILGGGGGLTEYDPSAVVFDNLPNINCKPIVTFLVDWKNN